jgi:hypothetical protein
MQETKGWVHIFSRGTAFRVDFGSCYCPLDERTWLLVSGRSTSCYSFWAFLTHCRHFICCDNEIRSWSLGFSRESGMSIFHWCCGEFLPTIRVSELNVRGKRLTLYWHRVVHMLSIYYILKVPKVLLSLSELLNFDCHDAGVAHYIHSAFRYLALSFGTAAILPSVNSLGHVATNTISALLSCLGFL